MRIDENLPAIVRPADELAEYAARINAAHEAGEESTRRGLEHFRRAGEDLLKVQARIGRGFRSWLVANVKVKRRRAYQYIKLANTPPTGDVENDWENWQRISGHKEHQSVQPAGHFDALSLLDTPDDEPDQGKVCSTLHTFAPDDVEADREPTDHNWIDKECRSIEWYTPEYILERVRSYFGGAIPLDPATAPQNPTQALRFFTEEQDGLNQDWSGEGVFVNPPYGNVLPDWARKIHEQAGTGTSIIALLPCGARFSTGYWQDYILCPRLDGLCFIRGRVAFLDVDGKPQEANPYDSAIYGYNVDRTAFADAFRPLGKVLIVKEDHE